MGKMLIYNSTALLMEYHASHGVLSTPAVWFALSWLITVLNFFAVQFHWLFGTMERAGCSGNSYSSKRRRILTKVKEHLSIFDTDQLETCDESYIDCCEPENGIIMVSTKRIMTVLVTTSWSLKSLKALMRTCRK